MSYSVTSSEPSSVGLPPPIFTPTNSTWSLTEVKNNDYDYNHHHHRPAVTTAAAAATAAATATATGVATNHWYPSLANVAMLASSPPHHREDHNDEATMYCPLCGRNNQSLNATPPPPTERSTLKTTGLFPTTAGDDNDNDNHNHNHNHHNNKNNNKNHHSDFELASMLQTAELKDAMNNNHNDNYNGEEAATAATTLAAAMGACWECIVAIANVNSNKELQQQKQQHQEEEAALASSLSIMENFQDEYHVATTMSPKATASIKAIEDDYYCYYQQQQQYSNNGQYDGYDSRNNEVTMGIGIGGTATTTSTVVYIGEYNHRGQRHGPHGELIWDNGDRYVGSFVCGKRTGTGTMFHRDGSTYTGDWLNNQMHGRGQRTFSNGDVYIGEYRHGQRCGGPNGKLKFVNGDLYVGSWDSNFFHGFGRYYFADGTALEGHFNHGKKQGKFKRQQSNGCLDILRYENDQIVGQGVRWNVARTKTWLLRAIVVVDKNKQQQQHRRVSSDDTFRTNNNNDSDLIRKHQRFGSTPNLASSENNRTDLFNHQRSTSYRTTTTTEPVVETQVMAITKRVCRIPIAQAVSIGYDCELGEAIRDTNPAFWSVGDFANNNNNNSFV